MIWSRLKPYSGLLLILLIYLPLATITSLRTPLSAGPDEGAHFMFARFLAKEGYLPLTPEDRKEAGYKSDQPPLNAFITALVFWGDLEAPPYVKMTNDVPRRHFAIPVEVVSKWLALSTEDPWLSEVLLWRVGRFLSIFFSGLTLVIIYFTAWLVFETAPARYVAATAAVMSLAFIPLFVFISGVFSYENLLGLWLALFLLTAIYLIKRTGPAWLYLLAGLWVGLAIVTKLSALTAPLALVGLVGIIARQAGWSKGQWISRLALSLTGVLAGAGWWVVWIELNLNQVKELGWLLGLLHPILVADGSDHTSVEISYLLSAGKIGQMIDFADQISFGEWVERFFRSFWQYDWHFPTRLFQALLVLTLLIIGGVVRVWRQNPAARRLLGFMLLYIAIFFILPLVRFFSVGQTLAGQGQHVMFPAAGAFAILMTWGLSAWFPARGAWPWLGGILLGLGMLGWSVAQSIQIYQPPLPVRTVPPLLPASAQATELDFGSIALTGYELKGLAGDARCCEPAQPALGVNLYWLAEELSLENYLSEVSLVDAQGQAQSIWLGHPANGRYPTKAWEPPDAVRDETWLPLAGLSPGLYSLNLRLIGAGGPLVIDDQTSFTLTQLELAEPAPQPSTFTVWQQGQVAAGLPTFASRSTIQITASPAVTLSMVGPDQTVWAPDQAAGPTRAFIVDPGWRKGDYRLRIEAAGQPAWDSDPILFANAEGRLTHPVPSQVTVNANFANQLMLLGYDLPQRRLMPGEGLPVILRWQALRSMPADFIMFTRLRDQQGKVWGGYDRKPREAYSTLLWISGEVVEDGFTLPINPDTPPGLYYLDIGFYLVVGEAPVSLPLVQNGQMSEVTHITLDPIKVGYLTGGPTAEAEPPQHQLNESFGSHFTLLGYSLGEPGGTEKAALAGPTLKLTLQWRCETPPPLNYTTFVHLRDSAGKTVAQQDQPPLKGAYPTSLWDPGEIVEDEITLSLPTLPPPGTYQLVAGWYDAQTGQRLAVEGNPANEVVVAEIEIP